MKKMFLVVIAVVWSFGALAQESGMSSRTRTTYSTTYGTTYSGASSMPLLRLQGVERNSRDAQSCAPGDTSQAARP